MGKKYLVEEIESYETDNSKILVYVFIFIILVWLNIMAIKSIFDGVISHDAEMLGILIGIIMSWIAGLILFVKKIHRGLIATIKNVFAKMFFLSIIFMTFFSMFVPYVCKVIFYNDWGIDFFQVFITFIFNIIIFTLCSFVITIIGMFAVVTIGLFFSYLFYKIFYRIKAINIKKTDCYEKIEKFCKTKKFREKVLTFKLFPNKIEFFDSNNLLLKSISFSDLGYSNLNLLSQFSLADLIKTHSQFKISIEGVFYEETNICVITMINRELYNKLKKINKQIMLERRERYFKVKRQLKEIKRERKRKYKENVRMGKVW